MLHGFDYRAIETADATINVALAGSGPPLVLLHGYPQTHAMWHRIAPELAESFTVVCPDLRGYGESSKPPTDDAHEPYSKRAMATDVAQVMTQLGFERFCIAGHDRGGRVAHRLALDAPDRIDRVAVLDIIPAHSVFAQIDKDAATGTYHWFFLSQPYDLPERLIGADPAFFLRWHLKSWSGGADEFFAAEALAAYERAFSDPATVHATCEDYRAGASIDLEHDEADLGRPLECPLFVLWGSRTKPGDLGAVWRDWALDVTAHALPCGHFLAEELPSETLAHLRRFFPG